MRRKNKAQSILTYLFLIVAAVVAILAMRIFLSRTVQEKYRQSFDVWGEGEQYKHGSTAAQYWGSSWENIKLKCPEVQSQVEALEKQIITLEARIIELEREAEFFLARAAALRNRAADVQREVDRLRQRGLDDEANRLAQMIPHLLNEAEEMERLAQERRQKAQQCREDIERIKQQIQEIKANYPQCF